MQKNKYIDYKEMVDFNKGVNSVKVIKQDTVFHYQPYKLYKQKIDKRNIHEQDAHSQFFNSSYNKKCITKDSTSYIREKVLQCELKKLQKKMYIPEISLDVHGLNQLQVKKELGKLILICYKEKIFCCAVIHGHGQNILKKQIPIWLSQHPNVLAFYQGSKTLGHDTKLFVLVDF